MQTWIIEGEEKVLVIDSGTPEITGFLNCLENRFEKPIVMFLSHGHIDHIGCLSQFDDCWCSKRDWPMLLKSWDGTVLHKNYEELSCRLHNIDEGDRIDLGGRIIRVFAIKGHTPGSLMLLDERTKILFSGDSVARRILYGLDYWNPLDQYLKTLENLSKIEIRGIASMHDDFLLPTEEPSYIVEEIINRLEGCERIWELPGTTRKFLYMKNDLGEDNINYFEMVLPLERKEEAVSQIQGFL